VFEPSRQVKSTIGEDFNLVTAFNKAPEAKKLVRADRVAMPERLQYLRCRGLRQGTPRADSGCCRLGRNWIDMCFAARLILMDVAKPSAQLIHRIARQTICADTIFDVLQQPVLAKPVGNRAIRQPRLRRDTNIEAAKQAVEIASFRRSVIFRDPNPAPDFIPQMGKIAIRQALLQALTGGGIEERGNFIVTYFIRTGSWPHDILKREFAQQPRKQRRPD
jgi:hypothetical protein